MDKKISIIAALAEDYTIGEKGKIPWNIPEDRKRFRELTMNKPVIMGRTTFESILERIRNPLEGRTNIVLTRNAKYSSADGIKIAHSIQEALELANQEALELAGEVAEVFIAGGEQVYKTGIEIATDMYLTHVSGFFPNGDAHFPKFEKEKWKEVWREDHNTLEEQKKHGLVYSFIDYRRKNI